MSLYIALFFFFGFALSTKLVEYKFGTYFGQIIYDSSDNGNHGQNGATKFQGTGDIKSSDRGAYFQNQESYIMLPPNNFVPTPISLSTTFSIIMWILPVEYSTGYLSYRIKDDSNFFYLKGDSTLGNLEAKIVINSSDSSYYIVPGNFSIDGWSIITIINQNHTCKFICNDQTILIVTLSSLYTETGTYLHYIGYYDQSFNGFIWSFYLFDEVASLPDFYNISDTQNSCLVGICPNTCNPAIVENGQSYCLPLNINISQSGSGFSCNSTCQNGCTDTFCLDCSDCLIDACYLTGGSLDCLCINGTVISTTCTCLEGKYLLDSGIVCADCHEDCFSCLDAFICLSCKDNNADTLNTVGCSCKSGYYKETALENRGACRGCNGECITCSDQYTCDECRDPNSNPHEIVGCTCKTGFYNDTALVDGGECFPCYNECLNCSNAFNCLECRYENSEKDDRLGCKCKNGFYNTSALINNGTCLECYEECETCSSKYKCNSCKDRNAEVVNESCTCNSGYFNSTNLTDTEGCLPCYEECRTCSSALLCDACKAANSLKNSTKGCNCEPGYYSNGLLTSEDSCIPCNSECSNCKELDLCLTCKDPNSSPSINQGCDCNEGYYKSTSLENSGVCLKCGQNCSVCESFEKCLECFFEKMNIQEGTCDCPLNSILINNTCVAYEGYYFEKNSSGYYTQECDSTCKSCTGPGKTACETCANNLLMVDKICDSCELGLYLESNICLNCSDQCLTCKDYSYCLTCPDSSIIPESGSCTLLCEPGQFFFNGSCSSCQSLCSICTSLSKCIECKDNTSYTDNVCLCSDGFKEEKNNCIKKYFNASLSISSKNLVSITFSESTLVNLKPEDFSFKIENNESFDVKLLKNKSNKELLFSLILEKSIKSGTKLEVTVLIEDLRSVSKAFLEKYKLSGELSEYIYISEDANSLMEVILEVSKASVKVGVSSSICSAIVGNQAASWTLLNTIHLLTFLPLSSLALTNNLVKFLKGIAEYNIFPSLFADYYPSETSGAPYLQAKNYGISTSVFVLNLGPNLIFFVAVTLAFPAVYVVSKITSGKFAEKATGLLVNYKFSFFLRFWTQMYLDIGVYSLIQLKATVNHWLGYFNQGISIICGIGFGVTPILVVISSFISALNIREGSTEFMIKWGSLYSEFKNDKGFWSSQYYFFYFLRRLIYLAVQVYLNEHLLVQGGIHIGCCIFIIYFLLRYRPFKSRLVLISNFISELGIFSVITLSYCYYLDLGNKTKEFLELIIVFIILSTLFLQFFISMKMFTRTLIDSFSKYLKKRNMEIARYVEEKFKNLHDN